MSARDRAARHMAACGSKPGGASAYYYKESCVRRDNVVEKGAHTRRVLDTHIKRLDKLRTAAGRASAEIRKRVGGKVAQTSHRTDSVRSIANITMSECLSSHKPMTLEEALSRALDDFNSKTKKGPVSGTISLLYCVCEDLQNIVESATLAAQAARKASKVAPDASSAKGKI